MTASGARCRDDACRGRGDGGITMVITALVLVALMVFAAFALDLGSVAVARRNDQAAVDAAAMAGAIAIAQEANPATIKSTVIDQAERNLEVTDLDWDSCAGYVDPGSGWSAVAGSDCIMRNGDRILVRSPDQSVKSVFGAVVGRASYAHRAFAVAGPQKIGFGSVLPFGVFTSSAGHVCLRTDNPSSPVSPCAGSSTGDSGVINLGLFGEATLGTPVECMGNGGGANGRAANNVAAGADHRIGTHPVPDTTVLDTAKCPDKQPPYPHAADTITGAGADQAITSGLFAGIQFYDGGPARLQRDSQSSYSPSKVTVESHAVDNTPLWAFIGDGLTDVPGACQRVQFEDALATFGSPANSIRDDVEAHLATASIEIRMEKMLERCFDLYALGAWDDGGSFTSSSPAGPGEVVTTTECGSAPGGLLGKKNPRCTGVVFNRNASVENPEIWDIQLVPRFGYVPEIHELLGSNTITFKSFQAIYIQRLCLGNQQCNQGTFSPGVGWVDQKPGSTNDTVSALSAWAFADHMLPGGLGGAGAPYDLNVNLYLRLIR